MLNLDKVLSVKKLIRFIYTISLLCSCHTLSATTFIIGTENIEYYPHYGISSPSSIEFEGFARAFFDDFSAKNDISISYSPQPITRLYFSLLIDESIDLKYPDSPDWNVRKKAKINKRIYYSQPISSYIDGVFVRKGNNTKLKNISHLGIVSGFTPEPFMDAIVSKKIKLLEFTKSDSLFKALQRKLVDAIYINVDVAKYQMVKNGITDIEFNENLPYTKGYYYISSINHPNIIKLIDNYIKENQTYISTLKHKLKLSH